MAYRLIRKHSLPEDEGRDECLGVFETEQEAIRHRNAIVTASCGYFRQSDFLVEGD